MPLPRLETTPPVMKMYLVTMPSPSPGPHATTGRRGGDRRRRSRAARAPAPAVSAWYLAPREARNARRSRGIVRCLRGAWRRPPRHSVRHDRRLGRRQGHHPARGRAVPGRPVLLRLRHHPRPAARRGARRPVLLPNAAAVRVDASRRRSARVGRVRGDYYGTPRAPVEAALADGRDVLLELELAGARQLKRALPEAVMIFIAPPSLAELERRLRGRGTDDEAKIQKRLARAREEIRAVREFDYAVVNDELGRAVQDFQAVVRAERVRAERLRDEDVRAFLRES